MGRRLLRLRGRLALWAGRPFFTPRFAHANNAVEARHKPTSYHEDWWMGQLIAIAHIGHDMRYGQPFEDVCSVNDWKVKTAEVAARSDALEHTGRLMDSSPERGEAWVCYGDCPACEMERTGASEPAS